MINVQNLDRDRTTLCDEKELLSHEAESVRTFYSRTGPARKEYAIQMAEAEAQRIRTVREAQADGVLAIRKAEAEGYRMIGEALAGLDNADQVLKLAGLMALQQVAQSLADGKATKLFLPHSLGDIFSLVAGWKETLTATPADAATAAGEGPGTPCRDA
jgi:regulator of protease activity HflC (stomatin/prohibitin superfamily)